MNAKKARRNHHSQAAMSQNVCACVCLCNQKSTNTSATFRGWATRQSRRWSVNPNTWVQILILPLTGVDDLVPIDLIMAQLSVCKVIIRVPNS